MHCLNCGSELRIGGPRCCDGGAAKRAMKQEEERAAEQRLAGIEGRLISLEKTMSAVLASLERFATKNTN